MSSIQGIVERLEADESLIHTPEFESLKQYMLNKGATIPEPEPVAEEQPQDMEGVEEATYEEDSTKEEKKEPEVEYDRSVHDNMGNPERTVSDEDMDKSGMLKSEAREKMASGDYIEAIHLLDEAIELSATSALTFGTRAECYFKMNRIDSAVIDADQAIKINPNSAKPYKVKARALAYKKDWENAYKFVCTALKFDYDEGMDALQKEIKIELDKGVKASYTAKSKEPEAKSEEKKGEEETHIPLNFGNIPGLGSDPKILEKIMQDPEMVTMLQDENLITALNDMMQNPSDAQKLQSYKDDPKVASFMKKMASIMQESQPQSET